MSEYWIFNLWPKSSKIRPPRKDKIKNFKHISLYQVVMTTKQNKSYEIGINAYEINYIKFINHKTGEVKRWSLHKCFKCKTYLKQYEHEFVLDNICFKCLKELIKEKKKMVKLNETIKRKSRKILL